MDMLRDNGQRAGVMSRKIGSDRTHIIFNKGLLEEGSTSYIYLLLEGDNIPCSTSNKR